MRDDELLAIYGATRQLAEGMAARDAELKKSTAALEAIIVQVHQTCFRGPRLVRMHMTCGRLYRGDSFWILQM
jgi:hypothetical protein